MVPAQPDESNVAPMSRVAAVILAAGKSTRMRSLTPKPLHSVCGLALTRHVVQACFAAGMTRVIVVTGHESERVRAGLGDDVEYVLQEEQLGSGHAAACAAPLLGDWPGPVAVLAGDVPLLLPETLQRLAGPILTGVCESAMLVARQADAAAYGRVILDEAGWVRQIVEFKDASAEQRAIQDWNPSVYCFSARKLFGYLQRVRPNNAQGEYYLTDVVGLMAADGNVTAPVRIDDPTEVEGVNTRVDLARVESAMRARILDRLMLGGVTVTDPTTTYVDVGVSVGMDTVIEPLTMLRGRTTIGEGCVIGPACHLVDATVGDACTIRSSYIADSILETGVRVGPFANIRPGCRIERDAKIGDFVELKNAHIGAGVAASHLSYIGDAEVGAHANIGAGTITCNYDGFQKHRTEIGNSAFIGSHSVLVAPVRVGDGAITGAGSTVTEDVPADALALARSAQVNRADWARRWREARNKRGSRHE